MHLSSPIVPSEIGTYYVVVWICSWIPPSIVDLKPSQEAGYDAQLLPLFDPRISPRNMALIAVRREGTRGAPRADVPYRTNSSGSLLCEPCVY